MNLYFTILLIPDREFSEYVSLDKHHLLRLHGKTFASAHAPAHLSICTLRIKAGDEAPLVSVLDNILANTKQISLESNSIDSFPQNGTLYIGLKKAAAYSSFQKMLTGRLKMSFPALKRNMSVANHPHITLGRGFSAAELLTYNTPAHFKAVERSFLCTRVRLMTRQQKQSRLYREWSLV